MTMLLISVAAIVTFDVVVVGVVAVNYVRRAQRGGVRAQRVKPAPTDNIRAVG